MKRSTFVTVIVIVIAVVFLVLMQRRTEVANPQELVQPRQDHTEPLRDTADQRHSAPQVLGTLPKFELTSHSGTPFGTDDLQYKVWVAGFMSTPETDTGPAHPRVMKLLQQELLQHPEARDIRLISVALDPQHDTPEILQKYAREQDVQDGFWTLLTGSRELIVDLVRNGFMRQVDDTASKTDSSIVHSTSLVLVDRHRRVRGHYEASDTNERDKLLRDLNAVLHERYGEPTEIFDPTWLEPRRLKQLATVDQFDVYHDFRFVDRRQESGITFRHKIVDHAGRDYQATHYDHGNGVAVADVDGDGRLDIYFVTQAGPNGLFRNLGDATFEDITDAAGVAVEQRICMTASFADVDNDGDADLFVTTIREGNLLFVNDGSGRFTDATQRSGLGHRGHSSAGVFFDYDRDGLLDLFLCNVGKFTKDELKAVTMEPVRGESPGDYEYYASFKDAFAGHLKPEERNERSILYRNSGDLRFEDVTAKAGLIDESWTGDASPVDLNGDGWLDLYVLNMQGNDEYYENQAGEKFVKKSRDIFPKTPWGSMGIKSFDYDNDGDQDILITDMHSDMSENIGPEKEKLKADMKFPESLLRTAGASIFGNAMYRNDGDGNFREISDEVGAENYWPWGLSVGDLNADGYDDVFITASMNIPFRYCVNTLLLNNQGRRFLDAEFILEVEPRRDNVTAIPYFELDCDGADANYPECKDRQGRVVAWSAIGSRASVIFDLDDDGDLDIVTNDFNSPPMVLISNLTDQRSVNCLKVQLIGSKSNRDGLGTVVTVRTNGATYTKVNDGQSGYLSQSRRPLYFGFGDESTIDSVEVRWPSGSMQVVAPPIPLNSVLEVCEE